MRKNKILILATLALLVFLATSQRSKAVGELMKSVSLPDVYYITSTGGRLAFPNQQTYFSWYTDFSGVQTVSDSDLANFPLVGTVTMRPGVKMIKIQTDPKVYAVAEGGILRWITSEQVAWDIYGQNWNKEIVDVPDTLFTNYTHGSDVTEINAEGTYSAVNATNNSPTIDIEQNKILAAKNSASTQKTSAPVVQQPVTAPVVETPAPEPSSACVKPVCLADHQALAYVGSQTGAGSYLLAPGQTREILPNVYARAENASYGSVWVKKDGTCSIKQATAAYPEYPGKTIIGDKFITFNEEGGSLRFNIYGGYDAYDQCIKNNKEAFGLMFCKSLPQSGWYTMAGNNFSRIFEGVQYSPAQSLSVDIDDIAYNRLASAFPAITKSQSYTGKWRITDIKNSDIINGAAGYTDNENIIVADDYTMPGTSYSYLNNYSTNGADYKKAMDFVKGSNQDSVTIWSLIWGPFIAETHEFTHGIFGNTRLGTFGMLNTKYGGFLVEGWANYLGNVAVASTPTRFSNWSDIHCGETQLLNDPYPPVKYSELLISNPYGSGQCFFSAVEKVCGTATINNFINEMFIEPSNPQTNYAHPLKMLGTFCPDKTKYQTIMSNFGFDEALISGSEPLAPNLLPGNACGI